MHEMGGRYLEQLDGHGFEVGDDFHTRSLCAQRSRVTTSTRVHAGDNGAEGGTERIPWRRVVDVSSHDDLLLANSTGRTNGRPFRHKRHMTRREIDIGATEFGVDLEDDIGAVLTFGVGNMFHLQVRLMR